MKHDFRKIVRQDERRHVDENFSFEDLLHPARAFARPSDVVNDADLTLNEKRAILASWASDACAEEANPMLRRASDGGTVPWDEIMDALKKLDLQTARSEAIRFDPEGFWWPRGGLRRGGPSGEGERGSGLA